MSDYIGQENPLLIIISGPSGVGKDAVIDELKQRKIPFHFVVTATTRPKRPEEVHSKDYWFYTPEEFYQLLKSGELLENAVVYNNSYGVPKHDVRDSLNRGEDTILRIDVQGAAHIKRVVPNALFIFIAPPNFEALINRLGNRNTETPESLNRRLSTYHTEMKAIPTFDYVVINHESLLSETADKIIAIITAEKLRTNPRRVTL
ncbi:guanylate kinase [Candidatus Chlorohelix sp.]|uniref:guanylate kinase n=1 Tax=Candidatus Chlorohelix sp. TaxID=3139201 RepID=UPI003048C586